MNIVIIDYGLGNLFSVKQACHRFGVDAKLSCNPSEILAADGLILPGVGAFHAAMQTLEDAGAAEAILQSVKQGTPLFGICLGMQLLFDQSEEFAESKGLGLIQGEIRRIPAEGRRVPHIGWNRVWPETQGWMHSALEDMPPGSYQYFVHSYRCIPANSEDSFCHTEYEGLRFCSAVKKGRIFATQFHPEKSGELGLRIYENWLHSVAQMHAGETRTSP